MGTDDAVEVPSIPEVAAEAPGAPAGKMVDMIGGKCDYMCEIMTEQGWYAHFCGCWFYFEKSSWKDLDYH